MVRIPHRDGCPYYEEPPERKVPIERLVPNDTMTSHNNCPACGGNHVMEECLIRDAILKQGFCDTCDAEPGRHYEDCPLIELYDDYGVCFYCTQRDHSYTRCPFLVKREADDDKPKAVRRKTEDTTQGREEVRRQLYYPRGDNVIGAQNHKPIREPEIEELSPQGGKTVNPGCLKDKTVDKYCRTHRMKGGLLPEVGCFEQGGHIGPIIGHQYDNDQVRMARILQQHYDQLKEEKEAAEKALKAHLTATQTKNTCDKCGRTGHTLDECPNLAKSFVVCQLCGERDHNAMGCPHNVVTRKREPCHKLNKRRRVQKFSFGPIL